MQWVHNTQCAAVMAAVLFLIGCTNMPANDRRIEGPYQCDNLSIYIVKGPSSGPHDDMLTLDEALARKYVTVFETGDVDELAIENSSDFPIYVPSGSILKGGRQDRVVRDDLLLAAKSGRLPLSSFCVESGRWSGRANADARKFESAAHIMPCIELKVAAKVKESQGDVWASVAAVQDTLSTKVRGGRANHAEYRTSLLMTMENEVVKDLTVNARDSLRKLVTLTPDAIGIVVAINNQLASADLYDSPGLFRKMFPQLLDAATLEATLKHRDSVTATLPTESEVFQWIDQARSDNPEIRTIEGGMITRMHTLDDKINFETYDKERPEQWVHKNVLKTK